MIQETRRLVKALQGQSKTLANESRIELFLMIAERPEIDVETMSEETSVDYPRLSAHLAWLLRDELIEAVSEKSAVSTRGEVFKLSKSGHELYRKAKRKKSSRATS